jgi:hypothetical protein
MILPEKFAAFYVHYSIHNSPPPVWHSSSPLPRTPLLYRPNVTQSLHLRPGLPCGFFPSVFPTKTLYVIHFPTYALHSRPSHSPDCITLIILKYRHRSIPYPALQWVGHSADRTISFERRSRLRLQLNVRLLCPRLTRNVTALQYRSVPSANCQSCRSSFCIYHPHPTPPHIIPLHPHNFLRNLLAKTLSQHF